MKKLFAWFGVIILTFAFGIFSTLTWLKFDEQEPKVEEIKDDLPMLAVCELVNNPEKYSGKKVRLSSNLNWYDHGFYLEDLNCHKKVENLEFYDENWRIAVGYKQEDSSRIFKELMGIIKNSENLFIAVGSFRKVEKSELFGNTIHGRTQLHFEVIEIENGQLDKK